MTNVDISQVVTHIYKLYRPLPDDFINRPTELLCLASMFYISTTMHWQIYSLKYTMVNVKKDTYMYFEADGERNLNVFLKKNKQFFSVYII